MSEPDRQESADKPSVPKRQLTLFDSTCIIVGIIIGAFFYETAPDVARCMARVSTEIGERIPLLDGSAEASSLGSWLVSAPVLLIGVWILGGIVSLIGALCYAELATAYPKQGGDYVYLTRSFGRWSGFLFAWAQLWVVRPGSIGALAFVFGRYANELVPLTDLCRPLGIDPMLVYAIGSILVLTGINMLGVREGKWTQNLLTTVKVIGLAAIFVVGMLYRSDQTAGTVASPPAWMDFRLAMIFVLITFGGWNEMAYVGAEVRDPRRNILRALVLGTVAVTAIYVLVNGAFILALGYDGLCRSNAVATDVVNLASPSGGRFISALICASALGAINGMIFTGARIYYAMGTEHRLYSWMGRWDKRKGTPIPSLLIQAAVTLALTVGFGWKGGEGGFKSMAIFTTPVFWAFFLPIGFTLFVLRWREPHVERPYRVPLYPVTPILFCLSSLFMLWSSLTYAYDNQSYEALWAIGIMAVGVVLCFFDPRPQADPNSERA